MNELVEMKCVIVLAVQYAIAWSFLGYWLGYNKKDDEINGREWFWLVMYLARKILSK